MMKLLVILNSLSYTTWLIQVISIKLEISKSSKLWSNHRNYVEWTFSVLHNIIFIHCLCGNPIISNSFFRYVFFLNNDLLVRTQSETFNSLPVQLVCQKLRRYHIITWSIMAYLLICIWTEWLITGVQNQLFAMSCLYITYLASWQDQSVVPFWMHLGKESYNPKSFRGPAFLSKK